MSVESRARKDAREYARSKMFYGEGAGTRRKLISATVEANAHRDPAYARAFRAELDKQDMAEHAAKAKKERKRKDNAEVVQKNVKGFLTGNSKSLNTSVLVVASVAYVAHQTGLDKKAWAKAKDTYANAKAKVNARRIIKAQGDNVYDISTLKKD